MIHRTTALYAPPVQLALAVLLVAEVKVHFAVVVVVTTKVLPNQLEEVTLVILDPSFHVYPTVPPPNVHQHAPSMRRDTAITILTYV
jgi:hypothetical protein